MAPVKGIDEDDPSTYLSPPTPSDFSTPPVPLDRHAAPYTPIPTFRLPKSDSRHYQQQYADMYFTRLAMLKPVAEATASAAWSDFSISGTKARRVERVLDVRQGDLCYVVGTVYMELGLKPNVLDDIGREHWIAAPPERESYLSGVAGGDQTMLEDESGRLRLTGVRLQQEMLMTGAIIAVLGTENSDGDFEVLDIRLPGAASLATVPATSTPVATVAGGKVAIVSGLGFTGNSGDTLALDLLQEYLLGSALSSPSTAQPIVRLIIAGNSLSHGQPIPTRADVAETKSRPRKYGYDSSTFNPAPAQQLDAWMAELLPSLPVTLIPGSTDPCGAQLPQQGIHPAMLPQSRAWMSLPSTTQSATTASQDSSWLDSTTNPTAFDLGGLRFLGTGGQPLTDVLRYLPTGTKPVDALATLMDLRLFAPTAPDTLWSFPFQDGDAFVVREGQGAHVVFAGDQEEFGSLGVRIGGDGEGGDGEGEGDGEDGDGEDGDWMRVLSIPRFSTTGTVVLLDLTTREVELVQIGVAEAL